jgi:2-haloacid dehalogenase
MLRGAIDDTVGIVAELQAAGRRLYALSNWSAETFPIALERFPFLGWFDGIVISGEVGIAKPDARSFGHLMERYELRPDATVFIDDSPINVDAAAGLGMTGLLFTSATELRRDLVRLGLLAGSSAD